MEAANEWTAICEHWAGRLSRDRGGNIPNGLHSVVADLADEYGAAAVLEAATSANDKRHAAAYELATWANQLVAVAMEVHEEAAKHVPPNAYRLQLLEGLESRCNKVSELAQQFTNSGEG